MAKRRTLYKNKTYSKLLPTSEKKIYNDLVSTVNEVNERLRQLEKTVINLNKGKYNSKTKRFEKRYDYIKTSTGTVKKPVKSIQKFRKGTWASKKLAKRLNEYYDVKTNRIKIDFSKQMKAIQVKNIRKAMELFLGSKTSTPKGISDVIKSTKEGIKNIIGDIRGFDEEDVEVLYDFFTDEDFNYTREYIDPSTTFVELAIAKTYSKGDPDYFIDRISKYIDKDSIYNDVEMKNRLTLIYEKFMDR